MCQKITLSALVIVLVALSSITVSSVVADDDTSSNDQNQAQQPMNRSNNDNPSQDGKSSIAKGVRNEGQDRDGRSSVVAAKTQLNHQQKQPNNQHHESNNNSNNQFKSNRIGLTRGLFARHHQFHPQSHRHLSSGLRDNFGFPVAMAATHNLPTVVSAPGAALGFERPSLRLKNYLAAAAAVGRPSKSQQHASNAFIDAQLAAASSELGLSAVAYPRVPKSGGANLVLKAPPPGSSSIGQSMFGKYRSRGRIPRLPHLPLVGIKATAGSFLSRPKDVALLLAGSGSSSLSPSAVAAAFAGLEPAHLSSSSKLKLPSFHLPLKLGSGSVIKPHKLIGLGILKKKPLKFYEALAGLDIPIIESPSRKPIFVPGPYMAPSKPHQHQIQQFPQIHSYKQVSL